MNAAAISRGAMTESRKKVSVWEKMAKRLVEYFEKYGAEITCGVLAISGNTNTALVYQMLKK